MSVDFMKTAVLALIAVVAIQGYYLYDMRHTETSPEKEPEPLSVLPSRPSDIRPFDKLLKERGDPFKEMERLQREMEENFRDFDDLFQHGSSFKHFFSPHDRMPRFDMKEHKGRYVITVEIHGSDKHSIEVKAEDGRLTISSKVSEEVEDDSTTYFRHKRRASSYKREISLPHDVDEGSMSTEYKDGVLTITLEKRKY